MAKKKKSSPKSSPAPKPARASRAKPTAKSGGKTRAAGAESSASRSKAPKKKAAVKAAAPSAKPAPKAAAAKPIARSSANNGTPRTPRAAAPSRSNPKPGAGGNHHRPTGHASTAGLLQRPGLPKPGSAGAKSNTVVLRDEPLTIAELRKVKTDLTRKEINHYKALLRQKREQLLGDVESLGKDTRDNGSGNLSHMPLHMADIGSDNYEQEFTFGLMETEAKLLREINEALQRINLGIYGICLETGKPLSRERLDAKPWAKYCIDVVRELERQGRM